MSDLSHALELFGFLSLDDVTVESLKRSFKNNIVKIHPDKGGDAEKFDDMLHSYVYLSETVNRIQGGRASLQNIVGPDQLKHMRADELINRIFEEFDIEHFNKEFEKKNLVTTHGYSEWLQNKDGESNLINGTFGEATQKLPSFSQNDMNHIFEEELKKGKPVPSSIILHPEAMAYISGSMMGTEIITSNTGSYTSEIFNNPEYTDVYAAFTHDNTIFDKVSDFKDENQTIDEKLDRVIAERSSEIKPFNDDELYKIQEFEKQKLENNKTHLSKIKEYFQTNANNSSFSALGLNPGSDDNTYGFIHNF